MNDSQTRQILDLAVTHATLQHRLDRTRQALQDAIRDTPDEHLRATLRIIVAEQL